MKACFWTTALPGAAGVRLVTKVHNFVYMHRDLIFLVAVLIAVQSMGLLACSRGLMTDFRPLTAKLSTINLDAKESHAFSFLVRLPPGRPSTPHISHCNRKVQLGCARAKSDVSSINFRDDSSAIRAPTKQADWKMGRFAHDDMNFVYHYSGKPTSLSADYPILVFLHGLTSSGPTLIPLLSDFSDEFQILLPTARGHGTSQPMAVGSFTMDKLVSDAAAVIRYFSPNRSVLLAGHSMGAATAARVAQQYPDLVRALVLEDPPWLRMPGEAIDPTLWAPPPFSHCRSLRAMSDEEFGTLNRKLGSDLVVEGAITQRESERLFDSDAIEPTFRATDDDINEAVLGITMPVLLQTGSGEHAVCTPRVAKAAIHTWTTGREDHYLGANHLIHAPPHESTWLKNVRAFLQNNFSLTLN